jgi:hypothetical protein
MARFIGSLAIGMLLALLVLPARAAPGILTEWQDTHWGESAGGLMREFGARATPLPWQIDFGDSYADVVLRDETIGGVPVIVYFQMDKETRGLKRIQIERPQHGVNPPAARAIVRALKTKYGLPERHCLVPPRLANGFQAAAEWSWRQRGARIHAIYRDTTIEAVEGCLGIEPMPCGLTGRLLVRISPAVGPPAACVASGR